MLRKYQIHSPLTKEHHCLIIGCGRSNHIELHLSDQFYSIDTDNFNPHLQGNIQEEEVQAYLGSNSFDLICIESVPQLITLGIIDKLERSRLVDGLFKLLSDDGVLMVLASGNIFNDKEFYADFFRHVDSFKLYNAYMKNCSNFPNCTLIAAKSKIFPEVVQSYIDKALEIKYNRPTVLRVEELEIRKPGQEAKEEISYTNLIKHHGLYQTLQSAVDESTILLPHQKNDDDNNCCACVLS